MGLKNLKLRVGLKKKKKFTTKAFNKWEFVFFFFLSDQKIESLVRKNCQIKKVRCRFLKMAGNCPMRKFSLRK